MPYKPYIQFHAYKTVCSCLRKIKLITPIETMLYGGKEIRFCKVYTFQEFYENREPIAERSNERMVAFGDIAQMLQRVNYVDHEIGLTWFMNNKHENVIIAFNEIDRNHSVYSNAGFIPAKIRGWDWNCRNANEKIRPLTNTEYVGHIRTISGINGAHTYGLHSLKEVLKARDELKLNEFIELALIKHYGPYKEYTWYHIKRHGYYRIK